MTQVFAQVARKQRATGSFLLLDTSTAESAAAVAAAMGQGEGRPFICRLEANVEPRCYDKLGHNDDGGDAPALQFTELLQWAEAQNMPTVAALGANNFKTMTRRGRPLCIAVVNPQNKDQVATATSELARYALQGPTAIREKYYYGWMDGKMFGRFLEQFQVFPKDAPQVFILDMPKKRYWQNETYGLNIDDFLQAVQDGTVEAKTAGKHGVEGVLIKFYNFMVAYRPWSVIPVVLVFVAFVVLILKCITPGKDLRPPYPREEKTDETKSESKEETKDGDETKKEK